MTMPTIPKVLPLLLLLAAAGCRGPLTHEARVTRATPQWYTTVRPDDGGKPMAQLAGRGAGSSRSQQVAIDMAKMAAFTDLGRSIDATFSGLAKQALEQVGTGRDGETVQHFSQATKVVMADLNVSGTTVARQVITDVEGVYYAWVMLNYPVGEANAKLLSDLRSNRATYERFRATQLYDDMNKEIEAYRTFQREQRPPR
jgi:hypothetical protein